jgi:hypothetical protein
MIIRNKHGHPANVYQPEKGGWVGYDVNAKLNNISAISWPSLSLVEETGDPSE